MSTPNATTEKKASGLRLRQTRMALCVKDKEFSSLRYFAEKTGVDEDNLSNWERGVAFTPHWYIQRLKDRWGVTFDWIFGDDRTGLPGWLGEALGAPAPKLRAIKGGRHK